MGIISKLVSKIIKTSAEDAAKKAAEKAAKEAAKKAAAKAAKEAAEKKAKEAGVRMGDKRNFQEGSAPKSTADTNVNKTSNKNTFVANPKEILSPKAALKAIKEDKDKVMKGVNINKQVDKKGNPLQGVTKTAVKKAAVRAGTRQATRAGYTAGVVGAGVAAAKAGKEEEKKAPLKGRPVQRSSAPVAKSDDTRVNKKDFPTYKKETKSAASFRDAFKSAKEDGKATFTFEGRTYNTKKEMAMGGSVTRVSAGPRLGK
jgi:hypothetical protein